VDTVVFGEEWGLGCASDIEYLGDPVESFVCEDFVVDRRRGSTTGGPGLVSRLMKDWVVPRPVMIPERCTGCGTCVTVCPVDPKAVDFASAEVRREKRPPEYDYGRCIRCYCCQEMCPDHAIEIHIPLLGRLLHRK
jgi:ferredoxin